MKKFSRLDLECCNHYTTLAQVRVVTLFSSISDLQLRLMFSELTGNHLVLKSGDARCSKLLYFLWI